MLVVVAYQKGILASQLSILYICQKFKKSIGASMRILKDNQSSLGPKGMEEEQVSLFETGAPMDDLFGSADDLEAAFDDIGGDAEN